jgi:hypothetical protein
MHEEGGVVDDDTMRDEPAPTSGERDTATAIDDAFVKITEAEAEAEDGDSPGTGVPDADDGLIDRDRAESFRRRWEDILVEFVDRPRGSVERADRLVLEVMQQLQASFTLARERLEAKWGEGSDTSTEDLRQALRRYRSFFDRLLDA